MRSVFEFFFGTEISELNQIIKNLENDYDKLLGENKRLKETVDLSIKQKNKYWDENIFLLNKNKKLEEKIKLLKKGKANVRKRKSK